MGFFKKIFKGIKKVIKKIGKGIKSAFKKVGKFMGKIGIIGQIGLALILPGVGQMLSGMLVGTGGTVGGLAGALQGMGAVGQAASSFIQGAVKVASNTSKFFSSVSDGVTQVVGDTIGAAAQSIGINADTMIGRGLDKLGVNMDVDGWGGVFSNTRGSLETIGQAGKNIFMPVAEPSQVASLAAGQAGQTAQVQEGLQGQLDSTTSFDVTSPVGETVVKAPSLSTEPFGPVGEIDGITYETGSSKYTFSPDPQIPNMAGDVAKALQENIATQGGAGTAANPFFASGQVTKPTSLLDRASEFITGKNIGENITAIRGQAAGAVASFIPDTGVALAKQAAGQALGVVAKPEDLKPVSYSSAVALGDFETSIGAVTTSPYQGLIDQVGSQYASANPYGLMAQQYNFNQYIEQARARGIA
tara:strand:+ start:3965 stop:5212 length:1248 start_codon:yes stop_codon:yes gene_type:complete